VELSCAFAPATATPDHVVVAETLGYRRAWFYDSPALYTDVWATMARAAERTSRIGLASGVLIPSLRHPMVTAAAIATLEELAPGRITMGVGSGFTGRYTLGQKPNAWRFVAEYVRAVQALLRGEEALWDGATIGMLHPPGFGAARPIEVPTVLGIGGPKGDEVARELADGIIVSGHAFPGWEWCARLTFGTVLRDGEGLDAPRVRQAAGHGAAVAFHALYERGDDLSRLPGGERWRHAIEEVIEHRRHLETHAGHLVHLNPLDESVITPELIGALTFTGTADHLRQQLDSFADGGISEIVFQPAGSDIAGELEAFAQLVS
jgi:5,10-methylenetetrahydromethanopterin reductase